MFTVTTIVFIILQIGVFLLSSLGNTVVVIVICKFIKRKTLTNKFITNLAVADLLIGAVSLLQIVYIIVPNLNENRYTCLLRYQVVVLLTLTSQLTVTFTTLDRYIAICYPHKYIQIMTETTSTVMILISWMYPSAMCIIPFTSLHIWDSDKRCLFQHVVKRWQLLWTALTLWTFTLLTLIMYGLILRKACVIYRHQLKVSVHVSNTEDKSARNARSIKSERRREQILSSLRGAKALATVTILFTICWLPHTYFQFRGFFRSDYLSSEEWETASWVVFLGMANSVMNPFIYAWQRKDFKHAMKRIIRCKCRLTPPLADSKTMAEEL